MKVRFLVISLVVLLAATAFALPPTGRSTKGTPPSAAGIDNEKYIDVNNILMFVANRGQLARDVSGVFGYDYGTFFPFNGVQYILDGSQISSPLYASGLWIGGIDSATGEKRVKVCEYKTEYRQGPYRDTGVDSLNFYPDAPEFRTFKLYSDSLEGNPNADYLEWPADMGAPVDALGNPKMIGDQMLWAVYNDADTANKNDAGSTNSLGLEIRQTTFGFRREGALNNVVFVKFQIFNKGNRTINNCYFSLWSDPDLGGSSDDLVGCDTLKSLGFCYNSTNSDNQYGARPPCTGYDFFQGPMVWTGDTLNDTAKAWDTLWPGYVNLGMVSFNKYINGTDPAIYTETYNYMQGLQSDGTPLSNGTKYNFPGDPVTKTGELDFDPADRRMMQSTGPITFRPGDSTEILAAIIFARGGDRLSSITVMKYFDVSAQNAYDLNFQIPEPPAAPIVNAAGLNGVVTLTWTDTSEIDPGDYPFQGYTVFQGETPSGPWRQIANYDIIDGTANIIDDVLDENTGILEQRAVKVASDNGLRRFVEVDEDILIGGSLHNLTTYFFKVEAYSLFESKTPKTLTSATIVEATPQPKMAQIDYPENYGDTLSATHVTGTSDGSVVPYVLDPNELTGHTYEVRFNTYPDSTLTWIPEESDTTLHTHVDTTDTICFITYDFDTIFCADTILDSMTIRVIEDSAHWQLDTVAVPYWILVDSTTGDTLLDSMLNQSGDEDYRVVDGMLIKVSGPANDFKNFEVVANNAGALTPSLPGAFGSAGFPTPDGANPVVGMQSTDSIRWAVITADNGGTAAGGSRNTYAAFLSRTSRDGSLWSEIIPHDYEIRFTGSPSNPGVGGSYCFDAYGTGSAAFWVPFELWDIGVATPANTADDFQMVAYLLDNDEDGTFNLSNYGKAPAPDSGNGGFEHSISGGDNDPYTDWIYWQRPADHTPGSAGYLAAEAEMIGSTYTGARETEVMARMVLVGWNLGILPPFTPDMPEVGTIWRITSTKPNTPGDVFRFHAAQRTVARSEDRLNEINVVPNPFYLFGPYDPAVTNRQIKFQHLPDVCTIRIFNLAGELVRTIEKTDGATSIETWDVLTENGLPVASGIYLYVVDAPGMGQKIGKMAVFTEAEVIQKY